MASGLFALLDDIVVLAKAAALSLDDIAVGAGKAGVKSAGVIIDDAAVTPQYVKGLSPKRELPIVWRITKGSLVNKFVFIIPILLLLSWLAPWALPFLLIAGGSYLVYEGAEKVLAWVGISHHDGEHAETVKEVSSKEHENKIVKSAVTTDLVLSAEIMLISMSNLETDNIFILIGMLTLVALAMTVLVYGAVGLLVKIDDIGLYYATNPKQSKLVRRFGFGLVKSMPKVFNVLSVVGTVAMLWVGGHILAKALYDVGVKFAYDFLHVITHAVEPAGAVIMWSVDTIVSAIMGLVVGLIYVGFITVFKKVQTKMLKTQ